MEACDFCFQGCVIMAANPGLGSDEAGEFVVSMAQAAQEDRSSHRVWWERSDLEIGTVLG